MITGCEDGNVRGWDSTTGKLVLPPWSHGGEIQSLALSTDGRWIASAGADRTARIWSIETGNERVAPLRHEHPVWFVEFSADGELVATAFSPSLTYWVTGPSFVQIWNARDGRPVTAPFGHGVPLVTPALSSDGARLIIGCANSEVGWADAHILDTRTGKEICAPLKHNSGVNWVAFSPNNRCVATVSVNVARVWDANSGEPLTDWMRHSGSINRVYFSPDGRRLLTTSQDHTAKLWDATTGDPLGPPLRHPAPVVLACFSPNGETLLTSDEEGTVLQWRCPTIGPPPEQLDLTSKIVSGMTVDSKSGLISLTPLQLQETFRQLQPARRIP